jgi:hypothetical protein
MWWIRLALVGVTLRFGRGVSQHMSIVLELVAPMLVKDTAHGSFVSLGRVRLR